VPRYLTADWLRALERAADTPEVAAATAGVRLTIRQVVTGGPEGEVSYEVVIADGTVRVGRTGAEPDVVFTQDHATAVALTKGELTAQAALRANRVRASGNLALLVDHQPALQAVTAAFGTVRHQTAYE
jgi:hypothetical protein